MIDRAIPEWTPLGKTVESAEDIFALNAVFRNPWFESVRLMAISPSSGEVIASSIHSVGNIYRTSGEVSDMIGFILAAREIDPEATLVISHNHPGGDPRPSEDDKALQEDLQSFADDLGIPIMDHVITNGTRGWSMKDGMEFRMEPEMDVPWSSIERLDMPRAADNRQLRDLGVALRAANESVNWVVYLDGRRRIRAMNLLPDDPKAAAKLILRDTSAHGTPNVVLFPGTTNQDAEQWAKPINALTSQEQSRPLDSFPIDPYEPSAKEDGHFSEGDGGYNVISIPSRDERSAGQSDGQPDIEAADSPANVLGTTYQPVPEQNLPDWARRGLAATEREAGGRGKVSVVQLGIKNPPGKSSTLRFSAELFSLFRKRILFVKGTEKPLPFDGMISPDDPNTLIIDADAPSGLTYLFGHELGHSIQHQRPDLYDALQKELLAMAGDWSDYREKLHASYRTEEQFRAEFTNDFIGNQMGDPVFWQRLHQRNPGIFRRLVDAALAFLKELGSRIGTLERDVRPYFKDIEAARTSLVKMPEDYQRGPMPESSVRARELPDHGNDNELSGKRHRR